MTRKIETGNIRILAMRNRFLDIDYKALEEKPGPQNVNINDQCESVNVDKNIVRIIYFREVSTGNNELFNIKVRVESVFEFNNDDSFSNDEYKKYFEDNYMYYYRTSSVASTISLIVGQMTAAFGRNPLLVAFKD